MYFGLLASLGLLVTSTSSSSLRRANTVTLDSATVTGTTTGRVTKYLGIPYAQPPTGDRRFRLPVAISSYSGAVDATAYGPRCHQHSSSIPLPTGLSADVLNVLINTTVKVMGDTSALLPDLNATTSTESEDCLNLNVEVPADATPTSKLPVVVWIYGGGFEAGYTAQYNGAPVVERSITLGQPIIYVSMNYRLNAFGFLPGKEIKKAKVGNLGLHDQREALRWVQKYISSFGGDPKKVTLWGESAGAISTSLQMLANNGNNQGLFRAAFMQSGAPIPVGDITHGQKYYDALVAETNCSSASDTLACLRTVPFDQLKEAADKSPSIFAYQSLIQPWTPRYDGVFLTDYPQRLVQQGKVAKIPFVSGGCDDEGTLFSLSTSNITTTSQLKAYLKEWWFPNTADSKVDKLLTLYPADITQGSPFDTGVLNALTPQFKRIAGFFGDVAFHAPSRFFLQQRSNKQNTWSYLSKRFKWLPFMGSYHGTDLAYTYPGGELQDYLIHFVNNLDPNGGTSVNWPKYTTSSPNVLTLKDNLATPPSVTPDTFRKDAIAYMTQLTLENPI